MGWRKASKDMTRIFNSSKEMKGRMGESLYSAPPLRPSGIFHLYQYFLFEFAGFVSKGRCRFPRLPRMQPVHTLGACGIPPTRDRGLSIVSVVLSIPLFIHVSPDNLCFFASTHCVSMVVPGCLSWSISRIDCIRLRVSGGATGKLISGIYAKTAPKGT